MRACLSPRKLRVSIYESHMKESSADCCRHPKVCTIRIPYVASLFFLAQTDTQNVMCATYMNSNSEWRIFRASETVTRMRDYTSMKYVLLLWTQSFNDGSKLKGQCTDVKSA